MTEAAPVNPRLHHAPVRAYNAFLLESFSPGFCACHRCREAGGAQDGYEYAHTFEFGGAIYNRRFASTADSDVLGALEAGWKSYFKTSLKTSGEVDLPAIHEFTDEVCRPFLRALLEASECAHDDDGILRFGRGRKKAPVKPVVQPAAMTEMVVPEHAATERPADELEGPAESQAGASAAAELPNEVTLSQAQAPAVADVPPRPAPVAYTQPVQGTLDLF